MQPPAHNRNYYFHEPSGIWCAEITDHLSFNLGNAVKYVFRAGKKDEEVECLRKAAWYLRRQASVVASGLPIREELAIKVAESDSGNVPMQLVMSLLFRGHTTESLGKSSCAIESYADGIEDAKSGVNMRAYRNHPDLETALRFWHMGHEKTLGITSP